VQVEKICSVKENIGRLAAGVLATVIAGFHVPLKKRIEPLQVASDNVSPRVSGAADLVTAG